MNTTTLSPAGDFHLLGFKRASLSNGLARLLMGPRPHGGAGRCLGGGQSQTGPSRFAHLHLGPAAGRAMQADCATSPPHVALCRRWCVRARSAFFPFACAARCPFPACWGTRPPTQNRLRVPASLLLRTLHPAPPASQGLPGFPNHHHFSRAYEYAYRPRTATTRRRHR